MLKVYCRAGSYNQYSLIYLIPQSQGTAKNELGIQTRSFDQLEDFVVTFVMRTLVDSMKTTRSCTKNLLHLFVNMYLCSIRLERQIARVSERHNGTLIQRND